MRNFVANFRRFRSEQWLGYILLMSAIQGTVAIMVAYFTGNLQLLASMLPNKNEAVLGSIVIVVVIAAGRHIGSQANSINWKWEPTAFFLFFFAREALFRGILLHTCGVWVQSIIFVLWCQSIEHLKGQVLEGNLIQKILRMLTAAGRDLVLGLALGELVMWCGTIWLGLLFVWVLALTQDLKQRLRNQFSITASVILGPIYQIALALLLARATGKLPQLNAQLELWHWWYIPLGMGLGTVAFLPMALLRIPTGPNQMFATRLNVLMISLVPSFSEELLYRGAVQNEFGVFASAILFALTHSYSKGNDRWWSHSHFMRARQVFIPGLLLALAKYLTGGLWPVIIGHTIANLIDGGIEYRRIKRHQAAESSMAAATPD